MSSDDIVGAVGREISRRTLLRRIGTGALATATVVLGLPAAAEAHTCHPSLVHYKCCCLCKNHNPSCSGCRCFWCWTCCNTHSGRLNYRCCECHTADPAPCTNDCDDVKCSIAVRISGGC
jgi:hypothetical protein